MRENFPLLLIEINIEWYYFRCKNMKMKILRYYINNLFNRIVRMNRKF